MSYRYFGIGLLSLVLAGCTGESAETNGVPDPAPAETAETVDAAPAPGPSVSETATSPKPTPAPSTRRPAPAPAATPSPGTAHENASVPEPVTSETVETPVATPPDRAASESPAATPPAVPARTTWVVPTGTKLPVILIDPVGTDISKTGDEFLASLAGPISVDGRTLFLKGTRVRGRVEEIESSGRVQGRASIRLVLTQILDGDRVVPISTQPFSQIAETNRKRDAAIGATGGAVGAVLGGLAGGKKGAVIGGAAGAAGAVMTTKGEEVSYPSESSLTFTLDESVTISLANTHS